MKITLIGYGKMGHMIASIAKNKGHEIASTIDTFAPDAIVKIPANEPSALAEAVKAIGISADDVKKVIYKQGKIINLIV